MQLSDFFEQLVEVNASDLYLTTGCPPSAKVEGELRCLSETVLKPDEVKGLAYEAMTPGQVVEFEKKLEMNLAISVPRVGRFRVNIFLQRNQVAMVVRYIKVNIPSTESLGLPVALQHIIMRKRGLILFVGAAGSGKSSSLASLIDFRNTHSRGHIITIEDPIEFMHSHKQCIVNQREVGIDTRSYTEALENTLRQAPDVIMIGEVRNQETMEHALSFSETGHLAISTLHANNANQAFGRIINFFPDERRKQALMDLSLNTIAIVSQRLVPGKDGTRVAAFEILTGTPMVKELILNGEFDQLKEVMEKSASAGMQTFDNALVDLYLEGKITEEEAISHADSQNNVRLKISLHDDGQSIAGLSHGNPEQEIEELANNRSVIEYAMQNAHAKIKRFAGEVLSQSSKDCDDLFIELYHRKLMTLNDVMTNAVDREKIVDRLTCKKQTGSSGLNLKLIDDEE